MKFKVEMNFEQIVLIKLNKESCTMWIDYDGLLLNNTGFPQKGVDYNSDNKLKIVGVDIA